MLARLPSSASAYNGGSARSAVANSANCAPTRSLSAIMPNPETLRPAWLRTGAAALTPASISHSAVEDPALMNAVAQQPKPNLQCGLRQQRQLARIEVLRACGGGIRPGVGPQMAQQGQRPSRGNDLGDRAEGAGRQGRLTERQRTPMWGWPARASRATASSSQPGSWAAATSVTQTPT